MYSKHLNIALMLQDESRQDVDVCLGRVALQHQNNHVVLIWENLAELLSEAGCFLWTSSEPSTSTFILLVLVTLVQSPSVSSPITSPYRSHSAAQCPVPVVQHLCLGARHFGGLERGG